MSDTDDQPPQPGAAVQPEPSTKLSLLKSFLSHLEALREHVIEEIEAEIKKLRGE